MCLIRRGHPCLEGQWNLDAWLACRHIDLAVHTRHYSETLDQSVTGMTLASYLAALFVVAKTDLIATLPASIGRHFLKHLDVVMMPPPLELPPIQVSLYWYERYQTDPAHAWLRRFIGEHSPAVVG